MSRPGRSFIPPRGPPRLSAKERVLVQWRGGSIGGGGTDLFRPAQPLGALLPQVLTRLGLDRKRTEAEIVRVWNHLLDPSVTAHAQPTGLVRGTLFITVDSSVWLSELVRYRRHEILDRLQHSFGCDMVRRLSFRVG